MSIQSKSMQGYILQAGEGITGDDPSLKASTISTRGGLTFIESRTTGGAPLHVHTREDEYFYILEGKIRVRLGDETFEVGPRSFVFLPRNVPHGWDVVGEEAILILMTVPAMLDEFLGKFHAAETREARDRIAADYGITFFW